MLLFCDFLALPLRTARSLANTIAISEKSLYQLSPHDRELGRRAARRFIKGYTWLAMDNFQRGLRKYKLRPKPLANISMRSKAYHIFPVSELNRGCTLTFTCGI